MSARPANLEQLIRNIAVDVGATEAAAFAVQRDFWDDLWTDALIHIRDDDSNAESRAAAVAAFKDIIAPCVEHGRDGAIEVDDSDDGKGKQFCIVTLGRCDSEVAAVAAFVVRCRDLDGARFVLSRVQRGASGL